MGRLTGSITHEAQRLSWTVPGRWYRNTITLWPRGELTLWCECQAFPTDGWCKHLAGEWRVFLDRYRSAVRDRTPRLPAWPSRSPNITDEAIAEHAERRDGHPPTPEYEGDPFEGLAAIKTGGDIRDLIGDPS